jgi:phosphoribosylformimino-5-aminoimidazole carboxamide ribotide isomerase
VELIPVIDLQAGVAVHAQKGLRHRYRPLEAFGDGTGAPDAVISAYLTLAPFRTFYIADLDALMGKEPQWDAIESLSENFPQLRFWVDAGLSKGPDQLQHRLRRVIGSESLPQGLMAPMASDEILSLDFREGALLGGVRILDQARWWPRQVIVMNLSVVGSLEGPDRERVSALLQTYPEVQVFAAGGVRHLSDLEALEAMGVSGVLLATALHQGHLQPERLQRWL